MAKAPRSFQKFQKIPLLFSIIFLAFSSYVLFFLYKQINNNKIMSEQMQTEWQTETSKRSQVASLDRLIKSIAQEKTLLESHFAESTNIVPFLDTIEKLATSVKADSQVISVDIAKDKTSLTVQLKATGSFQSIYKFLTLLENSPYELDFTSVDIRTDTLTSSPDSEEKAESPEWTADLRIKLLSFTP